MTSDCCIFVGRKYVSESAVIRSRHTTIIRYFDTTHVIRSRRFDAEENKLLSRWKFKNVAAEPNVI